MGLAKGASPRTFELVGADAAFLHDAQGAGKFRAEIALASAKARQGAQRLQQWAPAGNAAKIAFYPPHAEHGGGLYAIALLDLAQHGQPLPVGGAAVGHALFIDQHGQIVPGGHAEFRLAVEQGQNGGVRREGCHVLLPGAVRDIGKSRAVAQAGQAVRKGVGVNGRGRNFLRLAGGSGGQTQAGQGGRSDGKTHGDKYSG